MTGLAHSEQFTYVNCCLLTCSGCQGRCTKGPHRLDQALWVQPHTARQCFSVGRALFYANISMHSLAPLQCVSDLLI